MIKKTLGSDIKEVFGEAVVLGKWFLFLVLPCIYLLSGFYSVSLEERAIVVRFGKVINENVLPGMHYRVPWPIDQVTKLSATELKSMTIDYDKQSRAEYLQPEIITQGADLIDIKFDIQYNIDSPSAYFYTVEDPEGLVREIAISEVIYHVSKHDFEGLLTIGRIDIQSHIKHALQSRIEQIGLGVNIIGVFITHLDSPKSIKRAFDRVQVAPAEKNKLIQTAQGEKTTALVNAQSAVNEEYSHAIAYSEYVVQQAKGDRDRFLEKAEAMKLNSDLIINKEYVEYIESILGLAKVKLLNTQ
ncbi:protease modulator HflK [Vibrio sp. FNV 38]|nr:protease modulator HflK [Vibrio sp. FNV 38]